LPHTAEALHTADNIVMTIAVVITLNNIFCIRVTVASPFS